MALHPEVDSAIEDVVNEAIVSDTNDSPILNRIIEFECKRWHQKKDKRRV